MKKILLCMLLVPAMAFASCSKKAETTAADSPAAEPEQIAEAQTQTATTSGDVKVDTTGYTTLPSGLMYKVVKEGKGEKPTATSTVKVHYTGKHLNGETFDSSVERGEPISFPLNRVIPGWTEGVQLMPVGATYQFIIPSNLAYGPQGTPGGPIGPDETLYFEVELLGIE